MSAPVMRAGKQMHNTSGPKKWSVGEKLWDTMVRHKHVTTLTKCPMRVNESDVGNDSLWSCLENPEVYLSPESFSTHVAPECCELFNGVRVHVGVSELAGAILHFNYWVTDGVAREFVHPAVEIKWQALWERFEPSRQLSSQDFPKE